MGDEDQQGEQVIEGILAALEEAQRRCDGPAQAWTRRNLRRATVLIGGQQRPADEEIKAFFIEKYAPGASDIELAEFISKAITDQAVPGEDIYFIKYKGSPASIQYSINWMTRKANESGDFVGFTDPEYQDKEGNWSGFWESKSNAPHACRIGVIRKSTDKIGYSICRWDERAKDRAEWKKDKQGVHMLTKCTKAQGLRDAGFKGCSGRYAVEEAPEPPIERTGNWTNDPDKSPVENAIDHGRAGQKRREEENLFKRGDLTGKPTAEQLEEYRGFRTHIDETVIAKQMRKISGHTASTKLSSGEMETLLIHLRGLE